MFNLKLFRPQFCPFQRLNSTQSSAEYCLEQIKKYDYENFVCTLLLNETARSVAVAVRGFNVEVARVAEQTTQTNIGQMRLKFWDESIDQLYLKDPKLVPKHPVAIELFKAITARNISKRYLKHLVAARESLLNVRSLKSLEEMEKYAEHTVSSVYYLILEGCEVRDLHADHAVSHLGKAQGIVQFIRSIPHSRQLNFIPLPEDILIKHKLSQEQVIRQSDPKKLSDCVYEVATRAHQHLKKSRNLQIPSEAAQVMLPAIPMEIYLDKLQQLDYDVLNPKLANRSWKLLPKIYLSKLMKSY